MVGCAPRRGAHPTIASFIYGYPLTKLQNDLNHSLNESRCREVKYVDYLQARESQIVFDWVAASGPLVVREMKMPSPLYVVNA